MPGEAPRERGGGRTDRDDIRMRVSEVEREIDAIKLNMNSIEGALKGNREYLEEMRESFNRFRGAAGSDLAVARTQLDKLEPITEEQMRTLANGLQLLSRWGRRGIVALFVAAAGGGGLVELIQHVFAG